MSNRKILGTGSVVLAIVLSIVSVTIAYASYNSTLKINGSAKVKGTHWSIVFLNLSDAVAGNVNGESGVSTVKENSKPKIVGDTAIETYDVELATPGDFISYNFKIKNTGDFPAMIDSSFEMPTPSCTKGTQGKDSDAKNVCDYLEYTLKYVTTNDQGETVYTDVKRGDTLAVGETKDVQLKLYYRKEANNNGDLTLLPSDDVTISNLGISIPYIQQEQPSQPETSE